MLQSPRSLLLALLLPVSLACDSNDEGGDDAADATTAATTDTGTDTGTEAATDTGTDTGGPEDFPPVACGDLSCVEGQLCVMPSETCDYDQNPPMWVQDPSVCLDVPPSCYGLADDALLTCLTEGMCESGEELNAVLVEGVLDCPANGADCF
jgi:hypothetical protein